MSCCVNVTEFKNKTREAYWGICSSKSEIARGNWLITASFVLPEQIVWKKPNAEVCWWNCPFCALEGSAGNVFGRADKAYSNGKGLFQQKIGVLQCGSCSVREQCFLCSGGLAGMPHLDFPVPFALAGMGSLVLWLLMAGNYFKFFYLKTLA